MGTESDLREAFDRYYSEFDGAKRTLTQSAIENPIALDAFDDLLDELMHIAIYVLFQEKEGKIREIEIANDIKHIANGAKARADKIKFAIESKKDTDSDYKKFSIKFNRIIFEVLRSYPSKVYSTKLIWVHSRFLAMRQELDRGDRYE